MLAYLCQLKVFPFIAQQRRLSNSPTFNFTFGYTHWRVCASPVRLSTANVCVMYCMCSDSHAIFLSTLFRSHKQELMREYGQVRGRCVCVSYFRQKRIIVSHSFSLHTLHTNTMRERGQRCMCVVFLFLSAFHIISPFKLN
jgi:hypothetical protein